MKVEFAVDSQKQHTFAILKWGDVFLFQDVPFMKISEIYVNSMTKFNAVDLNGVPTNFDDYCPVKPIKGTFIIQGYDNEN